MAQATTDVVIAGDVQEVVENWVEVVPNLVFVLFGIHPDEGRPLLGHGKENGEVVVRGRASGKVILSTCGELAAKKPMGSPVGLLTL